MPPKNVRLTRIAHFVLVVFFWVCGARAQETPTEAVSAAPQAVAQDKVAKQSPRAGHMNSKERWKRYEPKPNEPGCTSDDITGDLIYPGFGASYVGGTIPNLRMGASIALFDPYGGRQLRRKGQIALSPNCLLFAFKGQRKEHFTEGNLPGTNLYIWGCEENVDLSKETRLCIQSKAPKAWVIAIPYGPITVLSRSRYSTADLLSISTGYAVAAAGLLTALSQGIKNSHTLEVSLGAATGAELLYYYFFVLRPRLTENYIAVFVENQYTPWEDEDSDETRLEFQGDKTTLKSQGNVAPGFPVKGLSGKATVKKQSDELFVESDVILLRVTNYHDYYNVGAILNARTGLTFVTETAEKPTK